MEVLRKKQLSSLRFRRQVPIGPFIVDFICFEKRLVIEVDGGQHGENKEYDEKRTIRLEDQGFRVIRFWNNEVMNNINGVATFILTMCSEFPPSCSSPARGEETYSQFQQLD
jgi:very-short-patch-repair endonuclease